MPHPQAKIHRMFELVEPIATVTSSEVPNEASLALGIRNYWDGYFAGPGRAAGAGTGGGGARGLLQLRRWRGGTPHLVGWGRPPRRRRSPYASGAAPPRCGR